MGNKRNIALLMVSVAAAVFVFSGCACPLISLFERSTGLKVRAGDKIDEENIVDELIYPGSVALVQVNGDIDKVLDLITTYGVSFSEEERQALQHLPPEIREQEVGALVYSSSDSRMMVLEYYEGLVGSGWQIQSFAGPGSGIQDSDIILAVKQERRQALMVTGSERNSFILFIDFDWDVFDEG